MSTLGSDAKLLKAGDVIIARKNSRPSRWSYWLMERDEVDEDRHRSDKNAVWVGGHCPVGFENDHPRRTSWDSWILDEQDAVVVPTNQWTDKICAMVAAWKLTQ